jgi:flagellar motor switch protein FliN/FliY
MSDKKDAVAIRSSNSSVRELLSVYDIPLHVTIEVGRMRVRVRDLMRLAPGAVIELKKPAGEPFDICVNGHSVARGEVIMVDQSSGVRIIDVQKPVGSA